jgi:hypothetical protein
LQRFAADRLLLRIVCRSSDWPSPFEVLETDRCRLTLEIDATGARVASLETG